MITRWTICLLMLFAPLASAKDFILAIGAPGTKDYQTLFDQQAEDWRKALADTFDVHTVTNKVTFQKTIEASESELWILMLGHGTDDGKYPRFNFRGPDLAPDELMAWLEPRTNHTVLVNCTAASAAFLSTLSAPKRTVISATRSGTETSFSHFGTFLTQALRERETADLDKDHALSLLEAFLYAARRVTEFYEADGRIQTETALIDDNGDKKGSQSDWFAGSRPIPGKTREGKTDGNAAMQQTLLPAKNAIELTDSEREQRNALEQQLFALREQRSNLGDEAYFAQLEGLLLKLSPFYLK